LINCSDYINQSQIWVEVTVIEDIQQSAYLMIMSVSTASFQWCEVSYQHHHFVTSNQLTMICSANLFVSLR